MAKSKIETEGKMKTEIYVKIETEFLDRNVYERLKGMSISSWWVNAKDGKPGNGVFIISTKDIDRFEAIICRKIELKEDETRKAISCCHPLKEELVTSLKKGRSEISVTERKEVFVVSTYRKGMATHNDVPRALVKEAWETIKKYKIEEYVACERVARNILKRLNITEFNKHGDDPSDFKNFNWKLLFGHRDQMGTGRGYFTYYYYPLKALQAKGLIAHFHDGSIRRLADDYDFDQTQLGFKSFVNKKKKPEDEYYKINIKKKLQKKREKVKKAKAL